MVCFDVTLEETKLIQKIAKRAVERDPELTMLGLDMDLSACHANGCPLRLTELLAADNLNFVHDIYGIRQNIDRETGQLQNCFCPRYAV